MGRKVALVVVLAVAVVLGIVLGPVLLGGGAPADPGPASPSATEPSETISATYATDEPTTAEPEPSGPSAREQADARAGVRTHDIPGEASGELRVVAGTVEAPDGDAPVMEVRVEVEEGLDVDDAAFASFVMDTLNDPRGWGADGSVRFSRTEGEADIRVVLATAALVDEMCAPLDTNGRWSCGRNGHAALNADRWVSGTTAWSDGGGSITNYRHYLVNHEVGHLLGFPHEGCPVPGEPAPIMVQQSISLDGCSPNGWPSP